MVAGFLENGLNFVWGSDIVREIFNNTKVVNNVKKVDILEPLNGKQV